MPIESMILIVLVVVGFAILFWLILRKSEVGGDKMKEERERLKEQLDSKIELAEKDLKSKKDIILEMIEQIRRELKETKETGVSIKTVIEEHKKTSEALSLATGNLKNLLSNNQLRGAWGERVAEDLLKLAGFQKGVSYTTQSQQSTNSSRPDITIFLPDKIKLNIDAKFPFQALQRYQETDDKTHLNQFKTDVKTKIKEIASRDYINPNENTVDFAVMFIPNEMIFSFIYEKFPDVWDEAIKNKVVMAGPFSLTAILRMVQQAYDNFKYQKNIHEIVTHIKDFEREYIKFSNTIDVLGNRLESTNKAFSQVSITRDKKLSSIIDKIRDDERILPESKDNDDFIKLPGLEKSKAEEDID